MATVTRDTPIIDLLRACPETRSVFARHGMGCVECMGALDENVGDSASMHGIDVGDLLAELNRVVASRPGPPVGQ